jgi:hypothetical protein
MPVNLINRCRISKALICLSLGLIVAAGVLPSDAKTKIVSFKDAAKLKTWDADDARSAQKWEEMRCVTREKLETLDLGLEEIGRLKVRHARDIKASGWSIGCETMDRDYSDWDQYKHFVGMLGAKRGRLLRDLVARRGHAREVREGRHSALLDERRDFRGVCPCVSGCAVGD